MSHSKDTTPREPETQKDLEPDEENMGTGSASEVKIGDLLKSERKKKGLSHSEISEITCLRVYILKALENEDWENLPSPVFVTGFIRSYAQALGLDESRLVSIYQRTFPLEASIPRPLMEPARSKKPLFVLFVFLLLTMAVAYYLWKEYPNRQKISTGPETITPAGNTIEKPKTPIELVAGHEPVSLEKKDETTSATQADLKATVGDSPGAQLEEQKEKTILMTQSDLKTTEGETRDVQKAKKEEKEDRRSSIEIPAQADHETLSIIEDFPLTLTAYVRERTWLKIYVDDGDPKEYIFNPGNSHEWKAREGFDVIIGNADGIDLEFNGEKIENLGAPGQVVRLVFPQYYLERSRN